MQGMTIFAHGHKRTRRMALQGGSVSAGHCVARSVDGGAGVARPAPWPPMRMDATNTGSGQRGKEIAVDFFDYAVIILLELSAFADWVESESVHPIPPISKVL